MVAVCGWPPSPLPLTHTSAPSSLVLLSRSLSYHHHHHHHRPSSLIIPTAIGSAALLVVVLLCCRFSCSHTTPVELTKLEVCHISYSQLHRATVGQFLGYHNCKTWHVGPIFLRHVPSILCFDSISSTRSVWFDRSDTIEILFVVVWPRALGMPRLSWSGHPNRQTDVCVFSCFRVA